MNKKLLSNSALLLTALIWGLSFVAQKSGMEFVGPFSFNFARCILGGLSLIPLIFVSKLIKKDTRSPEVRHLQHKNLALAGLSCGFVLFLAMSIQQYSMLYSTAGKAGFISSLYIIFVPLILMFFGRRITRNVIVSICLAIVGLYLLCFKDDISGFGFYDVLLLISAFFYGVHIIVVNKFSQIAEASKISCLQFLIVGILSGILMLIFENPNIDGFIACSVPIFYAGVLTCGVAYTLQIFGQRYTPPAVASLILSLESVFALAGGGIILGETMTVKEIIGCLFMISGVILSQMRLPRQPVLQAEVLSEDFDR